METYTQVTLIRTAGRIRWEQTSWIPAQFAKLGKTLRLRNEAGEWSDGWTVAEVSRSAPWPEVNFMSQRYKHQRAASDI